MASSDASGALEEQLEVFFNWLALAGDNSAALGWLIEGEHEIGNQIVASDKQKRERESLSPSSAPRITQCRTAES